MQYQLNKTSLEVTCGDITKQQVDAIVNAANTALCGGGGVDGAIHRAGGPTIMEECRKVKGGCPTGNAVATTAGDLPANLVIHTAGPVWSHGNSGEPELLAKCYQNSLRLATEKGCRSVAFPSISTGAYRFPIKSAAKIAWTTIWDYCESHPDALDLVRIVTFSRADEKVYTEALERSSAQVE